MTDTQKQMTRIWNGNEFITPTNTLEALIALNGWQGGTIHQVAKHYNTTASKILDLDFNIIVDILWSMNTGKIASKELMALTRKAYNTKAVSLQQVANIVISSKLNK